MNQTMLPIIALLVVLACALLVFLLAFRDQEEPARAPRKPAPAPRKSSAPAPRRAALAPLPGPAPAPKRPLPPDQGRQKEQKHFGLLPQVESAYRAAVKDPDPFSAQVEACISLCRKDIALAADCRAYWDRVYPGSPLPAYPAFTRLALLHEKRGEYQKAAKVCEKALGLGFTEDGTKGGMLGRLQRLQRKVLQGAAR